MFYKIEYYDYSCDEVFVMTVRSDSEHFLKEIVYNLEQDPGVYVRSVTIVDE